MVCHLAEKIRTTLPQSYSLCAFDGIHGEKLCENRLNMWDIIPPKMSPLEREKQSFKCSLGEIISVFLNAAQQLNKCDDDKFRNCSSYAYENEAR